MAVQRLSSEWTRRAACRDTFSEEWFPANEKGSIPDRIKQLCAGCPVRIECLRYAIGTDSKGIWAGTNTAQRAALMRNRSRAKCPVCSLAQPVDLLTCQVCMGCGASWDKPEAAGAKRRVHVQAQQ